MVKFFAFIGFGVTVAIAIWALSQCSFNLPGIGKLFSGSAMTSAALREPGKLLGDNRAPHHELSAGEAALKNAIAFVLYDWEAYSEIARQIGENLMVTDQELYSAVVARSLREFNQKRLSLLTVEQKRKMAAMLK